MSVVTVQLGQCGNQIGGDFFSTLIKDLTTQGQHCTEAQEKTYCTSSLERFFDETCSTTKSGIRNARAVMVDMEPKVIAQTIATANKSGTWKYPEKQQFSQKSGSGNNWAHGFAGHGPKSQESVLNLVRREVEKCDYFGGFLMLMSLAGGTGSGVGTYITQCLRDDYPNSFIINQVVWPYKMGEVIVQNYNTILTLANLYQSADAILTMDNDSLHLICSQLLDIKSPSFNDINHVISQKMASVFQPVYRGTDPSSWASPVRNHFGDMLEHLVPHPEYRLLTVRNIPQMSDRSLAYSTYHWPGLLKHLHQMVIADAALEEGIDWQVKPIPGSFNFNHSLANLLVVRGKDVGSCDTTSFSNPNLYTAWNHGSGLDVWSQPRAFGKYEKSAVVVSNGQSSAQALDSVVGKAWKMFASRAYVYQYLKHGLTEEDFIGSFTTLEQVISNYRNLS